MNRLLFLLIALIPSVFAQPTASHRLETLHQLALELESGINVLMLSLQPGFEDPATLAYLRFQRGARVTSAYVTNGGLSASDHGDEYPHLLAARLRREAFNAMQAIGSEAYFLNMPDILPYPDTSKVWSIWSRDSLRFQTLRLIRETKPDIVLLTADAAAGSASLAWSLFKNELLSIVTRMNARTEPSPGRVYDVDDWHVDRVLIEDMSTPTVSANTSLVHGLRKVSYQQMGAEANRAYVSLQSSEWLTGHRQRGYRLLLYSSKSAPKGIDSGLPKEVGRVLSRTRRNVASIAADVKKNPGAFSSRSRALNTLLNRVSDAIDSTGYYLRTTYGTLSLGDRRQLVHWKLGLEDLRNELLGVDLRYTFSETVLTNAQLTYLTIDTVIGIDSNGSLELFVPEAKTNWIVNEANRERWPLVLREQYRLISPFGLRYDMPAQEYGLERNTYGSPFTFYVIHGSNNRARNFALPVTARFFYAPKFTIEVLTPIVRLIPGENIVVRLTNHSRDGVADTLMIDHPQIRSTRHFFRLGYKGATSVQSLKLLYVEKGLEGNYLIPIHIGRDDVSQFGGRAFDVGVDSTIRVGVITGYVQSAVCETFRRLGVTWKKISGDSTLASELNEVDALVIDSRALTLVPGLSSQAAALETFVERGKKLILFTQDPSSWNRKPLIPSLRLSKTIPFDENSALDLMETDRLMSVPNVLTSQDWNEWIWTRTDRTCEIGPERYDIPVRLKANGTPLVVSKSMGNGRITYVNLAIQPQLLNVHAGAFRLLANLLSY